MNGADDRADGRGSRVSGFGVRVPEPLPRTRNPKPETRAGRVRLRTRRRYWVHPQLQLKLIGLIVGLEALSLAVMAWAVFVAVWQPLLADARLGSPAAGAREAFAEGLRHVTVTTLALFVLFGAICAAVGLLVSHSVAGPLVQVKGALRTAALEGRYDHRVKLRRTDSLHDVADDVNDLLEDLEARQRHERELMERVAAAIANVSAALQRGESVAEDVLEQTQELEGLVHRAAVRP